MSQRLLPHPGRSPSLWLLGLVLLLMTAGVLRAAGKPAPRRQPGPGRDEFGYPTNTVQAFEQGQAEARKDLTNGVLALKSFGLPAPETSEYQRLLLERCGVRVQPIAGCLVSAGLVAYRDGYNQVSSAVVTQRFGAEIFTRLHQEARSRVGRSNDPPPTPPRELPGPKPAVHTVQAGDTLVRIAQKHGVSLAALQAANPGLDPRRLQLGQQIQLPAGR